MTTQTIKKKNGYQKDKTCLTCGIPISDNARFCHAHATSGRPPHAIRTSPRTRPKTSLCECGLILGDHPTCNSCGARICSHYTYDTLIDYRGIKVCPFCYNLWISQEKIKGREISAKEIVKWGN